MKLTTLFLIVSLLQISATGISQETITLNLESAPLETVMNEIEQQSQYRFLYRHESVDNILVDLNATDAEITHVLHWLSESSNFEFQILEDKLVVVKEKSGNERKQQHQVTGRVVDAKGNPLPGVNIKIKGTTTGAVTDMDGNYTINVAENATLVFSYVGFLTEEIAIEGQSTINVTLIEDIQALDEVVVIGYGTAKKSDLTGSVASVQADELTSTSANAFNAALQGRVAGVQVTQGSSAPGGGITIRVRGTSSIASSSEPLYVVDGVPIIPNGAANPGSGAGNSFQTIPLNPLSYLNPNDIESIEILKDASATAIYGSRGANGVVLITTKRGEAGDTRVSFNASYGMQNIANTYDLMDANQYIQYANEQRIQRNLQEPETYTKYQDIYFPFVNGPVDRPSDVSSLTDAQYENIMNQVYDYYDNNSIDWQDAILADNAYVQNYNLSVLGGNESTKFAFSTSYFDEKGLIYGSDFKRYSIRLNLDKDITDRIRIGNSLSVSRTITNQMDTERNSSVQGPVNGALRWAPYIPPTQPDGTYTFWDSFGPDDLRAGDEENNPVAATREITNELNSTNILGNVFAEVDILEGLTFRTSFGANLTSNYRENFATSQVSLRGYSRLGYAQVANGELTSLVNENTINYSQTFGDHSINAVAGFTWQDEVAKNRTQNAFDIPVDILTINSIPLGGDNISVATGGNKFSMASYLGRINYTLKQRYLFTFTGRADGSSKFKGDNRWGFFPSGAVGWRISEEPFLDAIEAISNLKIRASWGITGNQEIPAYITTRQYRNVGGVIGYMPANYIFGTDGAETFGLAVGNLANTGLTWEETEQTNIGFDIGLFSGKLSLTADYFIRNTEKMLLQFTTPYSSGFSGVWKNIGELENKGFELQTDVYILNQADWQWHVSANIAFLNNKVTSLSEEIPYIGGPTISGNNRENDPIRAIEGEPLGVFYGHLTGGIFANEADIQSWQGGFQEPLGAVPGDVKFYDSNNDGELTTDDRVIIGNPNPDFIYGFNSDLSYRGVTLSIFIQGSQGNEILNLNKQNLFGSGVRINHHVERFTERWTEENTNAEWPRANPTTFTEELEDWYVEDGSYLRFKTITLGYDLPVQNLGWISRANVFVRGENLITITDYSGYNPDVNSFTGQGNLGLGVDKGAYPLAKIYTLGLKLNF